MTDTRTTLPDVPLSGRIRPGTAAELAAVTALIEHRADDQAVVFAYPGHGVGERYSELSGCTNQMLLLSSAQHELQRLGIGVAALSTEPSARHAHLDPALTSRIRRADAAAAGVLPHVDRAGERYLTRWTVILGGRWHGTLIEEIEDSVEHTRAVIDLLVATRLQSWAAVAGIEAQDARVTASYANGADSVGIVAFGGHPPIVAKVGPRDVITAEADFVDLVNGRLRDAGRPELFPLRFGTLVDGTIATSLMEQVDPTTMDEVVFADGGRWQLRPDAVATLRPHLDLLRQFYRSSAEQRPPTVGDYLYRQRFHEIVRHPGFRGSFAAFLPGWSLAGFLDAGLRLPGGRVLPSYRESLALLDDLAPGLLPAAGSLVHGDVHLRNMMRRADGTPVFVDPRTIWDGVDRPDIGYGDPVYDYATLLHSALPMSGILTAIAAGTAAGLLAGLPAAPADGVLDLTGLTTPFRLDAGLRELETCLVTASAETGGPKARARLHVGAANALAGWLKYEQALRHPAAWLAVYAYVLWYLDRAATSVTESA
ncbi:hypothetical protein GCM10010172_83820 [Paractinoplanes ferrugineus]|uniref:Aminoglycoside phosphotransferase domain-containing protein n=1 Tax=Paractinoplanes ferrugineus TaxID=113564 RepID=A0A919IYS3_9ACTN|nr:phosphotransferase [Actinoplanes ferrugineus]GIE10703.1 hypothetical protein Afe05nite_25430 [Actinoplanes ferrugineus]